ncbi:helix-turn-helix domain-containing protein [Streptomyces sp. NPDC059802]|uniref:helix-turn-helix domain-containing protein n=1 Tax=Streptomyces sp. NPDC059802 TaxID=3346952 RepID=UPI0036692550
MSKSTNSCASDAAPAASGKAPSVKPGQRLTGDLAESFRTYVVSLYSEPEPMSIRAICEKTRRSYGNIHRILKDAKVTLRNRGYQKPSGPKGHRDDVE